VADTRRLPVAVTDVWDWQMRGACRGMDNALFFHPENERGPARAEREARAKQICGGCLVLDRCRTHALAVHEPYGVWGGLSESERERDRPRPGPHAARPHHTGSAADHI
jgi:WhiB family redox-sensing transcriptional regulator